MRWLLLSVAVGCGLLFAGAASAQAELTVFRWVDEAGDLHFTDRLADVPEPYYSLYAAKLKALEEKKKQNKASRPAAVAPAPTAAPSPALKEKPVPKKKAKSYVDRELERRAMWIALIAKWRRALSAATDRVRKIQDQLDAVRFNPILRTLPKARLDAERFKQQRDRAVHRVEAARKMLLETLPARARKENVPPKWLL